MPPPDLASQLPAPAKPATPAPSGPELEGSQVHPMEPRYGVNAPTPVLPSILKPTLSQLKPEQTIHATPTQPPTFVVHEDVSLLGGKPTATVKRPEDQGAATTSNKDVHQQQQQPGPGPQVKKFYPHKDMFVCANKENGNPLFKCKRLQLGTQQRLKDQNRD